MNDKAFFPCAGFGTRMKEWTKKIPKPLLPIAGVPLIYYSLYWAERWGVKEGIANSHYLADVLEKNLKQFRTFPLRISREEPRILGTGGGIRTALERFWNLDEEFLILNPDFILFPKADFSPWPTLAEKDAYDCILYLSKIPPDADYTGLSLNDGKVEFSPGGYFYIGLSWIRGKCLRDLSPNEPYDLADTFRKLAKQGRLGGRIFPGEWLDLGEKEFYEAARNTDFGDKLGPGWKEFISTEA